MYQYSVKRLILLDNNDSFSYNIVELLRKTNHHDCVVVPSSECCDEEVLSFDKIIFSPGPGVPDDFPIMKRILEKRTERHYILGICLGFQAICEYYGGVLINKSSVVHGEPHPLTVESSSVLYGDIQQNITVGLYHSWEISRDSVKLPLEITSSANGAVMSVEHIDKRVFGVQYHPESYMTSFGNEIVSNLLSFE